MMLTANNEICEQNKYQHYNFNGPDNISNFFFVVHTYYIFDRTVAGMINFAWVLLDAIYWLNIVWFFPNISECVAER